MALAFRSRRRRLSRLHPSTCGGTTSTRSLGEQSAVIGRVSGGRATRSSRVGSARRSRTPSRRARLPHDRDGERAAHGVEAVGAPRSRFRIVGRSMASLGTGLYPPPGRTSRVSSSRAMTASVTPACQPAKHAEASSSRCSRSPVRSPLGRAEGGRRPQSRAEASRPHIAAARPGLALPLPRHAQGPARDPVPALGASSLLRAVVRRLARRPALRCP